MYDFEANEDPTRLPGSGQGAGADPFHLPRPIVPRVRRLREGHSLFGASAGRGGSSLLARRRRGARVACPLAAPPALVRAPSRRLRRMWTMCHGRPSGSPS
jgi:hypothetical protein